jgi:hypothetical protein
MSYLHCHHCGWSQDDFWSWNWKGVFKFWKWSYRPFGYNPISCILEDIVQYWKPRWIKFDSYWAVENGFKSNNIFSWALLIFEIKRQVQKFFRQKYWTYGSWLKAKKEKRYCCPTCGCLDNWDID